MNSIAIAIFAGILVVGAAGFLIIRHKVRQFSNELLGTPDLIEGFKNIEEDSASRPKSVNAMTSIYLPKIKRDFPEFNYDEMKSRAENVLRSYIRALNEMDASILAEGSPELYEKLRDRIEALEDAIYSETYEEITIHRTEISNYRQAAGRCIVTFQSAVQYYYSKVRETGELLDGSPTAYTQSRYDLDLIYIQDRDKIEDERDGALGANCPNCGAPLKGLGDKVCRYCGTPLKEINIYAWYFSDVRESV